MSAISPVPAMRRFPAFSLVAGPAVWLLSMLIVRPVPLERAWAEAILVFAALVLVPLGLRLIDSSGRALADRILTNVRDVLFPAGLLLGGAYFQPPGWIAALLASPWCVVTMLLAIAGALRLLRGPRQLDRLCESAALMFVSVGGGWMLLDRLGMRPLDFEPVIVLLTGIHFHYAGFALPLLTGLVIKRHRTPMSGLAAMGVVLGVPLVGLGITTSQLEMPRIIETVAAWILSIAAAAVGVLHLRLAGSRAYPPLVRALWGIAGSALIASMVLSAVYGTRFFVPIAWLDIPWMRALHGTANAFGLGLAGMAGWTLAGRYTDLGRPSVTD